MANKYLNTKKKYFSYRNARVIRFFYWVFVAQFLILCEFFFCRSLLVFQSFLFSPLYCMSFFNLRFLVTPFGIFKLLCSICTFSDSYILLAAVCGVCITHISYFLWSIFLIMLQTFNSCNRIISGWSFFSSVDEISDC